MAVTLAVLSAGGVAGGETTTASSTAAASLSAEARLALRRSPIVEAFEATKDAVVNISCTESHGPANGRRGWSGSTQMRSSGGSGFVVHADGYILTNAHVVTGCDTINITFADGQSDQAELIALDMQRDVALLKIDTDRPLTPITLGRSDDLMIGETVMVIGNPLGYEHTLTTGVISATGRSMHFPEDGSTLTNLIQTDAPINPGNSGGPLLNVLGELIGITTAIRGDAQGIGFAIGVDDLRTALPELLDIERRYRLTTGLRLSPTSPPRIIDVQPNTPAAKAGIKVGDTLRAINGSEVSEAISLHLAIMGHHPGESLIIEVGRDGQPIQHTLVLAPLPAPDPESLIRQRFGAEVRPLTDKEARAYHLPRGSGVRITEIIDGGPLIGSPLRPGDVIVAAEGRDPLRYSDFVSVIEAAEPGESLSIAFRWQSRNSTNEDRCQIIAN